MNDDRDLYVFVFCFGLFALGMVAHVVLAELGIVPWVWP